MKIFVAGLGAIGQRHVRNLRTLLGSDAEFVAYRVRREAPTLTDRLEVEKGIEVEQKLGITSYNDLDEALACRPDIALICNPTSEHVRVATAAALAGCDLFLEKPLSHDMAGVDELIDVVNQNKLVAMVGYQMRFHPCLQRVARTLKAKALGNLIAVFAEAGEYLPDWHPYEDYRNSYAARANLGGGVILTQIHDLDYLYSLFGMPRRLFAVGGHLSHLEIDVEDTANILLSCEWGGRSLPVHLHQDYVQRPPVRTCRIIGEKGTLIADFRNWTVKTFDREGSTTDDWTHDNPQRNQLFVEEMQHLLKCVQNRSEPVVSLRDAQRTLTLALAAKSSMDTGTAIDFA